MNNFIYCRAGDPYLHVWRSLAKVNSSYQNKYAKNLQKLKKNSLNKKSNCLFGEAVQVKVVIFLRGLNLSVNSL